MHLSTSKCCITSVCSQYACQLNASAHTSRCVLPLQAFVRYAAVNGAITVLREGISRLLLDPGSGRCTGVTTRSGQRLQCEALVANALVLRWVAGWRMGWDEIRGANLHAWNAYGMLGPACHLCHHACPCIPNP